VQQHCAAVILRKAMAVNTISATHIIDHDWSFPEVFDATLVNAHFIPDLNPGSTNR
jgi:hypothetical protein